jgi:hypothetical protein
VSGVTPPSTPFSWFFARLQRDRCQFHDEAYQEEIRDDILDSTAD